MLTVTVVKVPAVTTGGYLVIPQLLMVGVARLGLWRNDFSAESTVNIINSCVVVR